MSSKMVLIVDSDLSADGLESVVNLAPGQLDAVQSLENYLGAVSGGNQSADLTVNQGAVSASGTITSTGTATAAQTMKIANETLTAVASGADPAVGEFNVSATVGTQATSIALAINSMPELSGIVTAVANAGIVTVTAVVPGVVGNGIELVDVDLGNVTVAAMSGGSNGTQYVLNF